MSIYDPRTNPIPTLPPGQRQLPPIQLPQGPQSGVTQTGPQSPQPGLAQQAMDFLGSKGGQTAATMAAAGLQAYGANQTANRDREQSANQFGATMAQRQAEQDQTHQLAQAQGAANASPLGAEQEFAQRMGLMNAILPGARDFRSTPGDSGVAAAMGSREGGLRLGPNGLDPALIERLYGDATTMESIKNRQMQVGQINPRGPAMDLSSMYGDAGAGASQQVAGANQSELDRQMAESAKQREIIQRAIDNDIRGTNQPEKKKGNIFGKLLKTAGAGMSFVPGLGQVAAPILTGVGGMVDGDGVRRSLLNAGMSAVPGLAQAGKLGTTAQTIASNPFVRGATGGR